MDTPTNTLFNILNKISPISHESWEAAKSLFHIHHFEKNTHVIEMDDTVTELFFMISGLARYYYLTQEGKEFNKSFQTTGNVLTSISSLVEDKPSPFFIQTMLPTKCLSISYENLKSLGEKHPQWNRLNFSLLELVLIRKESREADFLLLDATQRYEKFLNEFSHVVDQIPNYHIASYLGITEVQLSRIRSHLKLT